MTLEVTQRIAAAIPNCGHTHVADSFHHVMIDNPSGLIAVINEFLSSLT
jgi:pimeloyl-ACP methyl ester carboxylesterase